MPEILLALWFYFTVVSIRRLPGPRGADRPLLVVIEEKAR